MRVLVVEDDQAMASSAVDGAISAPATVSASQAKATRRQWRRQIARQD
jgi:hypothetical protein